MLISPGRKAYPAGSNTPLEKTDKKMDKKLNNLPCLLCFETNEDSQSLQCGHIFCTVCIQEYNDFEFRPVAVDGEAVEKTLSCPVCDKSSIVVSRVKQAATTDVVNLRKQQLTRVESGIVLQRCDSCVFRGQTEIANLHCDKCSLNLCSSCVILHDACGVFGGHNLVHASNKENVGLQCEIHSKMSCVYFCKCCRKSVCSVCVLHYHSESRHDVVELKELLDLAAAQLKDLLKRVDSKKKGLTGKCERLLSTKQSASKLNRFEGGDRREISWEVAPSKRPKDNKKSDANGFHGLFSSISIAAKQTETSSTGGRNGFQAFFSTPQPTTPPTVPPGGVSESPGVEDLPPGSAMAAENEPTFNDNDSNSLGSEEFNQNSLTHRSALSMLKAKILNQRKSDKNAAKKAPSGSGFDTGSLSSRNALGSLASPDSPICEYVTTDDRKFVNRLQRCMDGWGKLRDFSAKLIEMPGNKKIHLIYENAISRSKVVLVCADRMDSELDDRLRLKTRRLREAGCILKEIGNTEVNPEGNANLKKSAKPFIASSSLQKTAAFYPKLLWKFEKPKIEISESSMPSASASLPCEELTVVAELDSLIDSNNRLTVLDIVGRPIGCLMQGDIQPLGMAITREGYIAVTDGKSKRIKILNTNGQLVSEMGKGQFGWPFGIATNSRGQFVVIDAFNDCVCVFSNEGKKLRSFGSTGSKESQLRNPYSVCVDKTDRIIVSDSGNNCVRIYDINGRLENTIADSGVAPQVNSRRTSVVTSPTLLPKLTQNSDVPQYSATDRKHRRRKLRTPRGVASDLHGRIYVTDEHSRVCLFDDNAVFQRLILGSDQEDGVHFPEALSTTRTGDQLIVSEWNASTVFSVKCYKLFE